MTGGVDFDSLMAAYQRERSREASEALWRAVFDLDEWVFLNVGSGESPRACSTMAGERLFVLAFTDAERAHAYAKQHGLLDEQGAAPIVAVGRDAVAEFLREAADDETYALLFNPGEMGFYTPLTNLGPMWRRFVAGLDAGPVGEIDELVEEARLTGETEATERLWKAVFSLPSWIFVGEPDDPERPHCMMVHDRPVAMIFTSREKAHNFAVREEMIGEDEEATLLETPPSHAAAWLAEAGSEGLGGAVFDEGVNGFYLPIEELDSLRREHLAGDAGASGAGG